MKKEINQLISIVATCSTLIFMCLFFMSCSKTSMSKAFPEDSFQKENVDLQGFNESTPLNLNGELVLFTNYRQSLDNSNVDPKLILQYEDGTIEDIATGHAFGCAIVVNNEIIVFASSGNSRIDMFRKTNGIWIEQAILLAEAGETLFNTSVTQTDNGFTIAYEVSRGNGRFTFKYATSNDLITWNKLGLIFDKDGYTACPTIRFFNGIYYVTYLAYQDGYFITQIARSSDLSSWEISPRPVLTPGADEGNNASDLDFTYVHGKTVLYYVDGDQLTWGHLRKGSYNGTPEQFLESFF